MVVYLSNQDASHHNYLPPTLQQQPNNDHHHRRLLERKTLSPAAKASVRMAQEMALSRAKANGHYIYENKADPFQEMQARAQADRYSIQQDAHQDNDSDAADDAALVHLRASVFWKDADPLTLPENGFTAIESLPTIEFEPQVEYLGVMVDAARNYFPIPWLKRLIVYLHKLRYNMIHLRLTDDENFVVRLDGYPQLAFSTSKDGTVYTPKELEGLVALAKSHNITIVPEVNVPLRAASWAGIPGLIVGCPNYICDVGHYVPLNIHHQDFETILQGILGEVLSIFDRPPMLHLGGTMSLQDADGCFDEAGVAKFGSTTQYLEKFEAILSSVLKKLSYPEKQVIRMESVESAKAVKGDDLARKQLTSRVGGIQHYWMSLPDGKETVTRYNNLSDSLVSTGVDFAVDHGLDAIGIYTNTLKIMQLAQKPKGIIAGTFFLGEDFFLEQNVLARLISVSMGAAHGSKSSVPISSFSASYDSICRSILTWQSHPLCELRGRPTVSPPAYLEAQMRKSQFRRRSVCNRLVTNINERVFQPYVPNQNFASTMGNELFWKTFHRAPSPHQPVLKKGSKPFQLLDEVKEWKRTVKKTGIILDFANSPPRIGDIIELVRDFVAPLGFDLLQIRLADDFAFAVKLEANAKLAQSEWSDQQQIPIPTSSDFKDLVNVAKTEWNMEIVPEISITTNAGGWMNGGFLVHCPKRYCKDGTGIPNDIREPQFLALVYSVLRELQETFGSSSYFHLGSDERVENLKCYEEDGLKPDEDPPFGSFEAKLKKMLLMLGIKPENVIRWDNDEQLSYEDRVGAITHYRIPVDPESLPDIREGEPFLLTADLFEGTIYSVYKRARDFARLKPMGIMGEIGTLVPRIWRERHMGVRLIALLLGVSSRGEAQKGDLSHNDFVKEAIKLCKAIKFPVYQEDPECKEAEKLLKSEKEKAADDDAAADEHGPFFFAGTSTEDFRESMCQKYTRPRKTMVMKEEFLSTIQ